jgi:hypothetical protein
VGEISPNVFSSIVAQSQRTRYQHISFTMPATPSAYATVSVSSGCLCFGALNNIWNGASMPVQDFPTPRLQRSGTVKVHFIEFNIAARNGIWNAFQLIDLTTNEVAAWFLAHSDVDPEREIDKILRVSGSPYEQDSGSVFNDDKTAAEGVFVINRYDWGYYDKRSQEDVVVAEELDGGFFSSAGLVDLAAATSAVLGWKDKPSSQREWSEGGAWLHIPGGEYMFGRFGFDDDRAAAHSFLFFTTNTHFTRTVFKGLEHTLRKEETPKERFERQLREGFDFSGLETLRNLSRVPDDPDVLSLFPPAPPQADCLGPYHRSEHVLRAQEINAIRLYRNAEEMKSDSGGQDWAAVRLGATIAEFIEPWAEPVYDVVNEMVLSYLQRTVVPHMGNRGVSAAAELLFPRHTPEGGGWQLDVWCYRHFTQPDALPIPDFDATYVGSRIASFLSRFADGPVVFEDKCVAGITRAVAYMLTEVLEQASSYARQNGEHAKIMPSDLRMVVYREAQLRERFQFSTVFWEGRIGSGSPE